MRAPLLLSAAAAAILMTGCQLPDGPVVTLPTIAAQPGAPADDDRKTYEDVRFLFRYDKALEARDYTLATEPTGFGSLYLSLGFPETTKVSVLMQPSAKDGAGIILMEIPRPVGASPANRNGPIPEGYTRFDMPGTDDAMFTSMERFRDGVPQRGRVSMFVRGEFVYALVVMMIGGTRSDLDALVTKTEESWSWK